MTRGVAVRQGWNRMTAPGYPRGVKLRLQSIVLLALLGRGPADVRADTPAPLPALSVTPLEPLTPGSRARLLVQVHGIPGGAGAFMLSAQAVGEAVELLRARLFRGDGQPLPDGGVVFELPLLGRAPGMAAIRLRLDAVVCGATCREVFLAESVTLEVRSR
jgi:hypothetical protein